jgi:hypothetical protein
MKRRVFAMMTGAILGASMMVVPSQAATVKNGVACSKANATTKVGSKVYRCGKNPYVKPTQLTWTLRGCFTANTLLKDARSQYEDWKDLAKLAGADGEKTLMELQTSITELENTMKNEVCKRGA